MGKTVTELLSGITAYELTEWEAYERAFGPLGPQYSDNALAEIHEELQKICYVLGAVNTGKDQENPVPEPRPVPRPHEMYRKLNAPEGSESEPEEQPMGLPEAIEFMKARQQ